MSESSAARSVLMKHPVGQHASGPWIDAKSIVKVMALKAPRDSTLHFRAEGEGAAEAVNALSALVARDFDEDHADAATS